MSTTITPTEQSIEINVNNDVIDINVTNNVVDVNATTQQIDINVAGAYPLPSSVFSVFGRVGDVVATEGDYTLTQLGDVTLTSPTNGQVLKYNGTNWVNGTDLNTGTVTSVAITETGDALTITGSPITTSGTINIAFAGTGAQYVKGDGTLATFPTTIEQARNLITEVYNRTGATLTKGTIVYINGGQGNLPTVTKAIATGDGTSAQTFGIVQADITNMNNGYVVIAGKLSDLDTQAYTEGTQLYLSSTTAGAYTSTKQYAPAHLVYVGIIVRSHPTQGIIEVKIQNGYELDEIHNVAAQTPTDNDGLFYEASTNLWKNKSISTILGGSPVLGSGTVNTMAKFTTSGTIGNSNLFDAGSTIYNINPSDGQYAWQFNASTTSGQSYGVNILAGTTSADIALKILNAAGSSEYLRVTGNGNLLVGTSTNGSFKADINGATRISGQLTLGSTITNGTYTYTLPGATGTLALVGGAGVGTVTSVAALTIGTSGTDLSSTVANSTTTPVITLNVPTASATNRGALSSADWTTFNNKQNALTNPITGTGTSGQVAYFNGTTSLTSSATFAFTPTSQLLVNNSVTAASAIARGTNLTPTLTAAANNDVLVGLDINPTFTLGAFTGTSRYALRTNAPYISLQNPQVRFSSATTASAFELVRFSGTTESHKFQFITGYNGPQLELFAQSTSGGTYDVNVMSFFRNGNIVINSTADAGFRLDVNGTARVQSFTTINAAPAVNSDSALTINVNTAASSSGQMYGIRNIVNPSSTNTGNINGIDSSINNISTAVNMQGFNSAVNVSANTTTTVKGYGVGGAVTGTGTVSTYIGFEHTDVFKSGSGSVNRQFGIRIMNLTAGGTANVGLLFNNAANTGVSGTWDIYAQSGNNSYLAGNLGIGNTSVDTTMLRISKAFTSTLTTSVFLDSQVSSTGTGQMNYINTIASTAAATFTVSSIRHINLTQGTFGAGSTVTNQFGVIVNGNMIGATNNYGFFGDIPSGTGRWNLYMGGTANNYLAGALGIGNTSLTGYNLRVQLNLTGATAFNNIFSAGTIQSDVTSSVNYFRTAASTQAASFTLGSLFHFSAVQGTLGAGSTVTDQYGIFIDSSLIGATNNYGFYGNIASGTNRWNIYMNGTAANYLNGDTAIGTTTLGTATKLTVGGSETASSAIARGQLLNTTLVAAANNDVLVGLDINPTFTNGAFTGVTNRQIRISNAAIALADMSFGLITGGGSYNSSFIQDGTGLTIGHNSASRTLSLQTNSTSRINITGGGNVGINTTTDAGFRLDVNGTARVQGTITSLVGNGNTSLNLTNAAGDSIFTNVISSTWSRTQFTSQSVSGFIYANPQNTIQGSVAFPTSIGFVTNTAGVSTAIGTTLGSTGGSCQYYCGNNSTINGHRFFYSNSERFRIESNGTTISDSGTINILSSALLNLDSTTRGFLPPRMTSAQRTAISSPATGLIVYQTDGVEGLWLRASTGWVQLTVV